MNRPSRPSRLVRAGFTLIELLAVILIVSILVATLTPMVNDAIENAKVAGCAANLREIYKGLVLYNTKYGGIPNQSGVKFFAALIAKGAMDNTKTNAERLTCPAIDKSALALGEMEWQEWWTDLERVDGTYSAYAGRDLKIHPLRQGLSSSGREPLVCDDNHGGLNHRTTTNVLYADGSVQTFEFKALQDEGKITKEETNLPVGADSPIEDLTKFSLD
jgi:prepilin-type N-terminal cleavage/methylation domain-containing protein/prepilin-type processing-associated H-X9-DG protein